MAEVRAELQVYCADKQELARPLEQVKAQTGHVAQVVVAVGAVLAAMKVVPEHTVHVKVAGVAVPLYAKT